MARPMADILYGAYLSAKSYVELWNAQGMGTYIPNDTTVIDDGSATDGRSPVTDAQVNNILNRCQELINWLETDQLTSGGTVTNAVLNTVAAVEVNGKSLF